MNFNFKLKKEHANLKDLIVQIINSTGLQIEKIIEDDEVYLFETVYENENDFDNFKDEISRNKIGWCLS